jgi:hypothetical protein
MTGRGAVKLELIIQSIFLSLLIRISGTRQPKAFLKSYKITFTFQHIDFCLIEAVVELHKLEKYLKIAFHFNLC